MRHARRHFQALQGGDVRTRKLALVVAGALAVTALAIPAAHAQQASPAGQGKAVAAGCEQAVADAAKSGVTKAMCVRQEKTTLTAAQLAKVQAAVRTKRAPKLAQRKPSGPSKPSHGKVGTQGVVDYCQDQPGSQWNKDRFSGCRGALRLWVDVIQRNPLVLIGRMSFTDVMMSFTNDEPGIWSLGHVLIPETAWGDYIGVMMEGGYTCSGYCFVEETNFPPTPVFTGETVATWGYAQSYVSADQVGVGTLKTSWRFTRPDLKPTGLTTAEAPEVRCDDTFGNRDTGCVFADVWPTYGLPSDAYPTVATHVYLSQDSGTVGKDWPLHRITDELRNAENREVACPDWMVAPAPNLSCDEYPFASTKEGAWMLPQMGRSFFYPGFYDCQMPHLPTNGSGTGWSACWVDANENKGAGADLLNFYADYRVVDQDPFFVEID
jgi:hypothetical protein